MRSNVWKAVIGRVFVLLILLTLAPYSYARDKDNIIKKVEVEGLTRIEEEEFIDLAYPDTGAGLDVHEIREGIKRAFRKKIFQDIKVVSEPAMGGVSLKYIVKEVPLVNKISVKGNENFTVRQIKKIFPFKKGEDYREGSLGKAVSAVRDFYRKKGYTEADVTIVVREIDNKPGINIRIHIKEGTPVIIDAVDAPKDGRRFVTLSAGDIYDQDEADEIINKLREYYKEKDYISPDVGPYTFENGRLKIPADPGKRLEVKFENNIVISARKLKKEVVFLENEDVSDELTAEIADRIKGLYVSRGYYYAEVAAVVEVEEDVIRVTFVIFEGKQVLLRLINYMGATINPDVIRKIISLNENAPYNDNLMKSSKDALVRFYNALGYLDTEITDVRKNFTNDGMVLDLEFYIKEGLRTNIEEIIIVGSERISELKVRNAVRIEKGAPYNVIDIGDARYRVISLYTQNGFMDVRVDVESILKEGKALLTFRIIENKPSVIGRIIIQGNNKTKAEIITREFTLHRGDYYDQEEITKIKQRLYKLGIFHEVSIEMLESGHEDDEKVVKDMLVSLKESNAGSVEFSLGFGDYEEFRGAFDVSYRNIGGYHREIGLRAELSAVEQRYVLNYKEPRLFDLPDIPLKIFLIRENTRSVNIKTREVRYKIDKFSFITGIEKELAKGLKAGLNYEYSYTDTSDVQSGVILSKEDTGSLGIGSISPSLFYDTRDNPFDPTSGFLYGVVLKFASQAFLSEVEFIKGSFHGAWFYQLYKKIILAVSLRGGASYGFEEIQELPLIERFFLGGRSTVRGYSHDTLGPKGDDGNPTGGNMFVMSNMELRMPVWKGVGLVTFLDIGNVWRSAEEVETELKYTTGGGIRYKTPVGPVRLDYGHKLSAEPGESIGEVHFSFGHAF